MTTEEEDPIMKLYEAQAILIEKEAEIEDLRRRIEEMERERQERNRGMRQKQERFSNKKRFRGSIYEQQRRLGGNIEIRGIECTSETEKFLLLFGPNLQIYSVEQSERTLEESMYRIETQKLEETEIIKIIRIIHDRVTALEETVDRIERRPEEIVPRLERNEVEGMEEMGETKKRLLERMTTLDDRIKGRDETILMMGGSGPKEAEMVILDRKTSTWKKLNLKLPYKNSGGGSAYLNDEIYIFGGWGIEKQLYKLDSQLMRWIELAEMNRERREISNSSLVFQGCIWVFGGDTVEKYCPERNEWIIMPKMSKIRSATSAAVCNEKIFVCGGSFLFTLKSVECFDPTSGVWTPMVDMPDCRMEHSVISEGSSLFVMGGYYTVNLWKTVWRIRPSEENAAWEELQPMNESRRYFTAKSLCSSTNDNKKEIYAIGGWDGQKSLDSVEIFDGERWREGPKLPNACQSMSSVVIPSSLAERLFSI